MTINYETTATDWFNRAFLDAVETALSTLGDSAKQVVYWYIFNTDDDLVGTGAMPQPESLARSLEKLLGSSAARIEWMVLNELSSRLGLALPQRQGRTFTQNVAFLQESIGHPS
jgi:hypothetical protein